MGRVCEEEIQRNRLYVTLRSEEKDKADASIKRNVYVYNGSFCSLGPKSMLGFHVSPGTLSREMSILKTLSM